MSGVSTELGVLIGRVVLAESSVWDYVKRLEKDALRYRWIRERGAWETEAFLNGLAPYQYDEAVDAAMRPPETQEPPP